MKSKYFRHLACCVLIAVAILGCQTGSSKDQLLQTDKSQVELRQIQSRAFDTVEREKTLRTVMATLQDLGFVIDKSDATLGMISATKLDGYQLKMTVTIRPRGDKQLLIRANAQFGLKAVEDPVPYQNFFTSLSKAMFLEAHGVD